MIQNIGISLSDSTWNTRRRLQDLLVLQGSPLLISWNFNYSWTFLFLLEYILIYYIVSCRILCSLTVSMLEHVSNFCWIRFGVHLLLTAAHWSRSKWRRSKWDCFIYDFLLFFFWEVSMFRHQISSGFTVWWTYSRRKIK